MNAMKRNNVTVRGNGPAMLFAHGFGCDQNMWRFVTPAFENDFTTILFDHVGAGGSDLNAYSSEKYGRLEGYAEDILELAAEMHLSDAIFVGHSVSAIIGVIAALEQPGLFSSLVLVAPSPSYINDGEYTGGCTRTEVEELLESLDKNHLGWSMAMAPVVMGNADRPELGNELANSFCRTDPNIARQFAKTTFLSDKRELLPQVGIPALILQCSDDVIAPEPVGRYMHANIKGRTLVQLEATGHCPNLSSPEETIAAIKKFLS